MLLEMTEEKARQMLDLSRELHWDFPSSRGTPIVKGHATSRRVEQAAQERESYANAARVLLQKGDEEGAVEIAANAWRLWMVAGTSPGDERFSQRYWTRVGRGRHEPDHSHYTVILS